MSERQRVFLGIEPSDDVRHALAAFLEDRLDGGDIPGKPVHPRSWHVTLRFLGSTAADELDRVAGLIGARLIDQDPFQMSFGGLGAFPRPERATVLWLGVDRGAEAARELAAICEEAVQHVGFAAEDRPFHPHLTLARIRPQERVTDLIERIGFFPGTQEVDNVTIYRSTTGRGGAEYTVLGQIPIGTPDARV